jgi:hypothetical protein
MNDSRNSFLRDTEKFGESRLFFSGSRPCADLQHLLGIQLGFAQMNAGSFSGVLRVVEISPTASGAVPPSHAPEQERHVRLRHTHPRGDLSLKKALLAEPLDLFDVPRRKAGLTVPLSRPIALSPFLKHVSRVVFRQPQEEVLHADARGGIAPVKNPHPGWDLSSKEFPSGSVRRNGLVADSKRSVAVGAARSGPQEASLPVTLVYALQKTLDRVFKGSSNLFHCSSFITLRRYREQAA